MPLTGCHWVAGAWSRRGNATFAAFDPTRGTPMPPDYVEATTAEIDAALQAAHDTHRSRALRQRSQRAVLLDRIAAGLEALGAELIDRAAAETALPAARLLAERDRTVAQLRMFAALVRDDAAWPERVEPGDPARTPHPKAELRRVLLPIGPVVVFGASNFPLAYSVAGGDTAAALAGGCPVVVKAHPCHPGTSELAAGAIAAALRATDLPSGAFSLLHGQSHGVGLALVRQPHTRAVGFTGSLRGGRALFDAAMQRPDPIPVHAEMGSVNPLFLLPQALATRGDAIAAGLARAVTANLGQMCTKPGIVFAPVGAAADRFVQQLAHELGRVPAGVMLHAGIATAYATGLCNRAAIPGVRRLGPASTDTPCRAAPALLITDATTFRRHGELADELFGPCALVVLCDGRDDMLAMADSLAGQLTATVHATAADHAAFAGLVDTLADKAGRLVFDGFPTGVEVCGAMVHGGPYPATTEVRATSVGPAAMERFLRPVCYQGSPRPT